MENHKQMVEPKYNKHNTDPQTPTHQTNKPDFVPKLVLALQHH